jgi:hypothetical protein
MPVLPNCPYARGTSKHLLLTRVRADAAGAFRFLRGVAKGRERNAKGSRKGERPVSDYPPNH